MGDVYVEKSSTKSVISGKKSSSVSRVAEMEAEAKERRYAEWRERESRLLRELEAVTSRPQVEQELFLKHILEKNAKTKYLQKCGLNGATDVASFRKCVPVVGYEAYRDIVQRIADGDSSALLSADPPKELMLSSGTSSGESKIFAITAEDIELRFLIWNLVGPVLNRSLPSLQKGKYLYFCCVREGYREGGGLIRHSATTSFVRSSFKQRSFDPSYQLTSPDEVLASSDTEGAMYCHLLCGLLQRLEVVRIGAIFAAALVKAFHCLDKWLPEICEDIATGTLSETRVKGEDLKSAVLPLLQRHCPDTELSEFVRKECSKKDACEGIIRRLWPNVQLLDTCCTGTMQAYLGCLSSLSDNLKVINSQLYASTEGFFGINLNPDCSPEEIYYTLLPSIAYYEFIPVRQPAPELGVVDELVEHQLNDLKVHPVVETQDSLCPEEAEDDYCILDLANLKVGREYELLVTTISGLYRLHVGDILKMVGFYNSTPMFRFMRRTNVVLSIDSDKTDEQDLHNAVTRAVQVLQTELPSLRLALHDYTSYAELTSPAKPGHYVIFWELSSPSSSSTPHDQGLDIISSEVLERCCSVLEASLNFVYREARSENNIGPLELQLVRAGTFDLLFEYAVSRGTSLSQYKTPRGLNPAKNPDPVQIMTSRTLQTHFSRSKPPLTFRSR